MRRVILGLAGGVALSVLLGGCQTFPGPERREAPRSGETVLRAAPVPAEPGLTPDDLLAMARGGATSEAVIARFTASGVRFDLTPTQIVDLAARGLPLPVLEAIHLARERALQNECAQRLVDLDRRCSEDVLRERRRALSCPDPYWPGRPGWRGGMYWGW